MTLTMIKAVEGNSVADDVEQSGSATGVIRDRETATRDHEEDDKKCGG